MKYSRMGDVLNFADTMFIINLLNEMKETVDVPFVEKPIKMPSGVGSISYLVTQIMC